MTVACVGHFLEFSSVSLVACLLVNINWYNELKSRTIAFNYVWRHVIFEHRSKHVEYKFGISQER